jgi:hypothetical protein
VPQYWQDEFVLVYQRRSGEGKSGG